MEFTRSSALIWTGLPPRSTVMPASRETYFALLRNRSSEVSSLSSKTSATATRSTFSFPVSRFTTACVPRPPQPTSPALRRSLDDAPRARAAADVAARKLRREKLLEGCIWGHHITNPRSALRAAEWKAFPECGAHGWRRNRALLETFQTAHGFGIQVQN